ncbi:hypothetical protein JCM15908A_07560 [Prevotella dentasini JCM 15908]
MEKAVSVNQVAPYLSNMSAGNEEIKDYIGRISSNCSADGQIVDNKKFNKT